MSETSVGFLEIAQSVLEARERRQADGEAVFGASAVGANDFYERAGKLGDYLNVLFTWLRLARLAMMQGHKTWREFAADKGRFDLKDFCELSDPIFEQYEERVLLPHPSKVVSEDSKYSKFADSPLGREVELTERLLDESVDDGAKVLDLKVKERMFRRSAVQRARGVLAQLVEEIGQDRAFRKDLKDRREERSRRKAS
jgi:hypothetical protein